ncbi:response regulator [Candidatus Saccharibacteria bacterium]|nr:response regulator [Candidatus Saccharibacteria bacterium]
MIFIIDDDKIMAECVSRAVGDVDKIRFFDNAIEAMNEIASGVMPKLIFLDILLNGPDGFTFLNEMVSYKDTAQIPVVVISSLDFGVDNLEMYGVVGILNKDTMLPKEIKEYAQKYAK